MSTSATPPPPVSLIVIAHLFFSSGLWAMFDMLSTLGTQITWINFGALGLIIGVGLLRYNIYARSGAMIFLWIGMILLPLLALMIWLGDPNNLHVFWQGKRIEPTQNIRLIACSLVMLCFAFTYWMYRMLRSQSIRVLFGKGDPPHPHQGFVTVDKQVTDS